MVKLDITGYDKDIANIDLVALKSDKICSSINTTVYILLKTHKEERKSSSCPPPSLSPTTYEDHGTEM
jgi:hypothetical protein